MCPDAFMGVVEQRAVEIHDNDDPRRESNVAGNKVRNRRVCNETHCPITNGLTNRAVMRFKRFVLHRPIIPNKMGTGLGQSAFMTCTHSFAYATLWVRIYATPFWIHSACTTVVATSLLVGSGSPIISPINFFRETPT